MSLSRYKKKRDFKKTAEPKGKEVRRRGAPIFVVQQHSASHLHWDFRLEMEGVLKSWAVPKGPSLNPDDKRLAMMVEDHPFDYKDFEGTIPEGNYGAGNVIVWDNGTYEARATKDWKEGEKILLDGIKKGHITFILHGKKLKGEFALVQMKDRGENTWLLLKKNDEYASKDDILKKDKSVISRKKLVLRQPISLRRRMTRKAAAMKEEPEKVFSKKKSNLIIPMLASLGDEPFDGSDWVYEIKYDGYRAVADIDKGGDVQLYSRNLLSFNDVYSDIVDELQKINRDCVLDGEVVVEDEKGRSHFQLLQQYQKTGEGPLLYYVFDLLRLDGKELIKKPLTERKEMLKQLLKRYKLANIFYSEHIEEHGKAFYEAALKNNLEGIMAKKADGLYHSGYRSREWLKIKITKQQEAIIIGITEPRGSRKHFGSLLLGVYKDSKLQYCGNCGTGFNASALKELYEKFESYFIDSPPKELAGEMPKQKSKWAAMRGNTAVQWMKPKFVCEVKFTEWTGDGSMRHPVYLGLRKDKAPAEVVRELPGETMKGKDTEAKHNAKPAKKKPEQADDASSSKNQSDYELKVGTVTLKLTNQNKIYFPYEGITKGDVVNYYNEVAEFILPYLKDRPESLNRYPNGIKGPSFFQKDMSETKLPKWIKTQRIYSESNEEYIYYLLCNDKATLIHLANLGCIEINPWNSRIQSKENPDWVVIDLDPEDIGFKEVVNAAKEVHNLLEEIKVPSYCKTSGATGLHIYIPLAAKYDYDIAKEFAHVVASIVNERLPQTTSILRLPKKRQGKVYLDFLQNRKGQTLAAPYSARPKAGATVSTPLDWDEVNAKLDPKNFTIRNTIKRLEKMGDIWKPVIGKGVDINKALARLK
jgi:bifunctional non-homologous end joining protein LigD